MKSGDGKVGFDELDVVVEAAAKFIHRRRTPRAP